MNQISRCDWLPERARWSYLALIYHALVFNPNKSFVGKACSVKVAGDWPRCLRVYGPGQSRGPETRKKRT